MSRLGRSIRALPLALGLLGLVLGACTADRSELSGAIAVLPTTGTVDGVMASYLDSGLDVAASGGAKAAIIQLDTPGGSLDATQDIVTTLLDPPLPTIVWVGPPGAWAASAGTFITLSANLAYMAPGTNIGAASPVDSSGQDISGTLGEKVKNNAMAQMTAIAQARGRAVDPAVATVDKASSYPATQAAAIGIVDGIAASLEEVRAKADGRIVEVNGAPVTLALAGAPLVELPMNPFQSLLHLLSDPNIAFILFTVGFYGLLFELQNPNFVTGILGALAIILAFIGFGSLPLNIAGLLLIGLGLVLLALEPTVTSHGLLTVGGIACITLGGFALYTEPGTPGAPDIAVAYPVLATVVGSLGIIGALIAVGVVRSRRMRGAPGMVGEAVVPGTVGEVRRSLDPVGSIYAAGEEWSARTEDERPLRRGTPVRVIRIEGLTAIVEPLAAESSGAGAAG